MRLCLSIGGECVLLPPPHVLSVPVAISSLQNEELKTTCETLTLVARTSLGSLR